VKWNDAKLQVKTETFEVEDDFDHHKNISVMMMLCLPELS